MASARSSTSTPVLADSANPVHRISLLDTTKPPEVDETDTVSESGTSLRDTPTRLSKRLTIQNELREKRNKWKYGRYTAEREAGRTRTLEEHENVEAEEPEASRDAQSFKHGKGHLSRGKQKVVDKYASLRGRRAARLVIDADSEIDVLYENQRGWFLFGHPLFSSNALWQIDVKAWTDSKGGQSSVNITTLRSQIQAGSGHGRIGMWIWAVMLMKKDGSTPSGFQRELPGMEPIHGSIALCGEESGFAKGRERKSREQTRFLGMLI
jgi:hypothetical protein